MLPVACLSLFGGTVSPQLAAMQPNQQVQVIVRYTPSIVGALSSTVCGLNLLQLLPGGELCSTTASTALGLVQHSAVEHVSINNTVLSASTPLPVYDYSPQTIQPLNPRSGVADPGAGKNIGVAIIDSGIHVNGDLRGNGSASIPGNLLPQVSYAESFVKGEDADDYYGHGTHVAGIIAGNGSNSSGRAYLYNIHGIAAGVHLLNLKVLDKNGSSSDVIVIQAIERAIQLRSLFNIKVINLSLGRPVFESYKDDPLCQEVEKAWLAGITVVVAAETRDAAMRPAPTDMPPSWLRAMTHSSSRSAP